MGSDINPGGEPAFATEAPRLGRPDRTRWDRAAIAGGLAALAGTGGDGPYAVQARIAACHATANPVEATDWPAIARGTTGRYGCSARRWWR